jgi:hypothetical protein
MAVRAEVLVTHVKVAGVARPAQTAGVVADGHKFRNDGRVRIEVENVHGTLARVITFQTPGKVLGILAVAEHTVSVPALTTLIIGPLPPKVFNQAAHMVYIDYPEVGYADLKIRLIELG